MTVVFEGLEGTSGPVEVEALPGQTLLDVCLDHQLPMDTACGGFAACNSCRVLLVEGSLSPLDPIEEPFLDLPAHRLGCQARVVGRARVRMDPGSA